MIEREIPKDVRKYKKKFVASLSFRQTMCAVPGVVLAIGTYFLVGKLFDGDAKVVSALLVALPFFLFGWVEIYKMPLERFLKVAFNSMFISPQKRLYKTKSTAAIKTKPSVADSSQKKKAKTKQSSNYPQYK